MAKCNVLTGSAVKGLNSPMYYLFINIRVDI